MASYKNRPHMTRHSLDLYSPLDRRISLADCSTIMAMAGVDIIHCDMESGHLEITYDLNQVDLDAIERRLLELGYVPKRDMLHQIRHNLAHFFEKNEIRSWT